MSAGKAANRRPTVISRRRISRRRISKQQGFTYLALLIAVAVGGVVLASIGELASHSQQREKEAQLLFVGQEYRQAIAAYYERSPGGAKRYPQKLDDMLEDKRYPFLQRYLRRPYADPVTGKVEWGLMEAPGGGIMGIYSLSEAKPIKSGAFRERDESFAEATKYADWQFFYRPPAVSAAGGPPSGPAANAAPPK